MLRRRLGEAEFWAGVTNYLARFECDVAETFDFRKELEAVSGENLQIFFEEWLTDGCGYPKLEASFEYVGDTGMVTFGVEQVQRNEELDVGLFSFELRIELTDANDVTQVKFIDFDQKVEEQVKKSVTFTCGAPPKMLRIDPNNDLLFEIDINPGLDILSYTAANAQDVPNRMRSHKELIKIGSPAAIAAVSSALSKEPSFHVRTQVAEYLQAAKSAVAVQVLARQVRQEEDPRALAAIFTEAGKVKDGVLKKALLWRCTAPATRLPPLAMAALAQALAQQGGDDVLELLTNEVTNSAPMHNLEYAGWIEALGEHRSAAAYAMLRSLVPYGAEHRWKCRAAVTKAFAKSALWQDKTAQRESIDILRQLLRDPSERVRRAAAQGVSDLKAPTAAADLTAVQATLPAQDNFWIHKLKLAARDSDKSKQALTAEVDVLNNKVRQLEDKLNKVLAIFEAKMEGEEDK